MHEAPGIPRLEYSAEKKRPAIGPVVRALMFATLAIVLAMASYFLQPPRYVANSYIKINPIPDQTGRVEWTTFVKAADDLAASLQRPENLAAAIAAAPSPVKQWTADAITQRLRITHIPHSSFIVVRCRDSDPAAASLGANAICVYAAWRWPTSGVVVMPSYANRQPQRSPLYALIGAAIAAAAAGAWLWFHRPRPTENVR
jgi:hypothetical protein